MQFSVFDQLGFKYPTFSDWDASWSVNDMIAPKKGKEFDGILDMSINLHLTWA